MKDLSEEKPKKPKKHPFRTVFILCISAAAAYNLVTNVITAADSIKSGGKRPYLEAVGSAGIDDGSGGNGTGGNGSGGNETGGNGTDNLIDADYQEETVDEYEAYWAEQGTYESRELTEPEVVKGGLHCSYYGHSAVDGGEMKEAVEELLREQGFGEIEPERIPYNQRITYESGAEKTIYNIGYYYEYISDGRKPAPYSDSKLSQTGSYNSVEVGYDTATGETHYVIVRSGDIDFIVKAAVKMTACFDSRDPESRPDEAMLEKGLREQMDLEDGSYWMTNKNWELYAYREPSGCSLSIGAMYQ